MENKRTETNKTVQKRLEPELKLINMDTVEVEQIEWLLYPFIPYGKVTIIQGEMCIRDRLQWAENNYIDVYMPIISRKEYKMMDRALRLI